MCRISDFELRKEGCNFTKVNRCGDMKKILVASLLLLALGSIAHGQGCSVCTKAAAGLDDKSAKGLNGGIVYLAFLPLTFMGAIGFVWWRHNRGKAH
jgi:hypothetical protein